MPDPKLPTFEGGEGQPVRTQRGGLSGVSAIPGRSVLTEAAVPASETPETLIGESTEVGESRGQKVVGGDRPTVPGAPKPTSSPFTAKGTLQTQASPDVLLGISAREKRIHDAQTLQRLTDMRASGATEQQMLAWAQINDEDAEVASAVADEHFPRMRQKVRSLQQQVDDARSLKVDPFNWHTSIGRGGRVAASFAALTGGFAAGKANPNTAVKMMQTAIEQDIAAQEQDIKNTFEALKTQKGLLADERLLLDEQLNSMNNIRATKYAAIVGRIQAAKQHAVTEAHNLAFQTAEDHFELKMLQAIAAAQKEVLRLELDGPIKNAAQLVALKRDIAQMQGQLQARPAGGITLPTEKVSTLTGDVVGERPEAEIKVAPAPSRAAAVGARRPGPTAGPSGRPVVQQAPAEAPSPVTPQPIEDVEAGISRIETQEEAEARVARETEQTAAAGVGQRVATNIRRIAVSDPDIAAPKHVAARGSFARTIAQDAEESVVGITTWDQALEDINAGRRIRNGGMTGTRDAEVVAAGLSKTPPRAAMFKGGAASAAFSMAQARHEFIQRFPEVLERPSSLNGERATIRAGGKTYRVGAGARDKDTYGEAKAEIIKRDRAIESLFQMGDIIKRKGLSGLISTDEGWQIPGITTSDPASLEMYNQAITQAMTYIKTHDPTARISDKDLEVGMDAAVPYLGKMDKFIDFVQSLDGPENNTKRRQVENFLRRLAVEATRIMYQQVENDVVPDFNTLQAVEDRAREVDSWIRQKPNPGR